MTQSLQLLKTLLISDAAREAIGQSLPPTPSSASLAGFLLFGFSNDTSTETWVVDAVPIDDLPINQAGGGNWRRAVTCVTHRPHATTLPNTGAATAAVTTSALRPLGVLLVLLKEQPQGDDSAGMARRALDATAAAETYLGHTTSAGPVGSPVLWAVAVEAAAFFTSKNSEQHFPLVNALGTSSPATSPPPSAPPAVLTAPAESKQNEATGSFGPGTVALLRVSASVAVGPQDLFVWTPLSAGGSTESSSAVSTYLRAGVFCALPSPRPANSRPVVASGNVAPAALLERLEGPNHNYGVRPVPVVLVGRSDCSEHRLDASLLSCAVQENALFESSAGTSSAPPSSSMALVALQARSLCGMVVEYRWGTGSGDDANDGTTATSSSPPSAITTANQPTKQQVLANMAADTPSRPASAPSALCGDKPVVAEQPSAVAAYLIAATAVLLLAVGATLIFSSATVVAHK